MIRFCIASLFSVASVATLALPAFPGAEGFGTETTGGRGGKIIHVTNLENSGPGSLREAIDASGPRIVVFDVSGTIKLWNALIIHDPYITIAGQTAPGDGITLSGDTFGVATHDVVVRFIRSRLGGANSRAEDAISIVSGYNIVFDHVSASWSIDEAFSPSGNKNSQLRDITLQWCAIAEPLNQSRHTKGHHGYNMLLRATGGISLHHNLYAHADSRNPRFGDNYFRGEPTYDFRNNVIYDWGHIASGMVDGRMNVNYVNNYLKPGPSTVDQRAPIVLTDKANADTRFFVAGNLVIGRDEQATDSNKMFATENIKAGDTGYTLMPTPFETPAVKTSSAAEAYTQVLAHAGASVPKRDAVDERIFRQVLTGTGRIINSTDEVGGWPELKSTPAPLDTDGDGMPDDWESANDLDPKNPADAPQLRPDGYMQIEYYLNTLAEKKITGYLKTSTR